MKQFIKRLTIGLTYLVMIWSGALIVGHSINFISKIINDFNVPGTLLDKLLSLSPYYPLRNIFISLLLMIFLEVLISIPLVIYASITRKDSTVVSKPILNLFVPLWITLWLVLTFDDLGFTIITSVVSFLALLIETIKIFDSTKRH